MSAYYPASIAAGLLLLTLSFLLPEPSVGTTSRILAAVAFALALIFALLAR